MTVILYCNCRNAAKNQADRMDSKEVVEYLVYPQ